MCFIMDSVYTKQGFNLQFCLNLTHLNSFVPFFISKDATFFEAANAQNWGLFWAFARP